MATQILRTSGDYQISTGTGSSGTNQIIIDSNTTRILGKLVVDGTQTIVNSTTVSIDDAFIELIRNNSGTILDGGIYINRGTAGDNAVFFWSAADNLFKAATTTNSSTTSPLTSTSLARIQAADPLSDSDVATQGYVNTAITSAGGNFSLSFTGDDSNVKLVPAGNTVTIAGGTNINTYTTDPQTIKVNLNQNLDGISSITSYGTNSDLTLKANGTGRIIIDHVMQFGSATSSDPTATSNTQIYTKTASSGETGIFFNNTNINSGTAGELISKKKAVAYSIALS